MHLPSWLTRWSSCAVLAIALALATTELHAQTEAPVADRLAAIAQSFANNSQFKGAVLVARDDEVLLNRGYGTASVERGLPNGPQVRYLLASISKQFTAAAVLRLVDQGKLRLTDPLRTHLPEVPAAWSAITVEHLLAHTSGIPNTVSGPGTVQLDRRRATPADLYARFRDAPLSFVPGSDWNYSNSGYIVLGILIEKLSGLSYAEFVRQELLAPLGMRDSGVATGDAEVPGLASDQLCNDSSPVPACVIHMSVPYSAGALYSTTGDLLKWQRGLYGGKVLSAASLKAMTTPGRANYGLGLFISKNRAGHQVYVHNGGIPGFSTLLAYEPEARLSFALLANVDNLPMDPLVRKLSAAARGVPVVLLEERRFITLQSEVLARYAGTYRLNENTAFTVEVLDGAPWIHFNSTPKTRLLVQSPSDFYVPAFDDEMRFTLGPDGQPIALTRNPGPGSKAWPRDGAAPLSR